MQRNSLVIIAKSLNYAAYILLKAEQYSSVRNEFYTYIRKNKKLAHDTLLYKTVYHYVIETSKRKNLLDEIIRTQNIPVNSADTHTALVVHILRILAYILYEQEYTKEKPTPKELIFVTKILAQVNATIHEETLNNYLKQLLQFKKSVWEKEKFSHYPSSKQLALKYFHPQWYIDYFQHYWDNTEVEQLLKANNSPKVQWIRIITPATSTKEDLAVFKKKIEETMQNQEIILAPDQTFPDIYKVVSVGRTPVAESLPVKKHAVVIQNKASTISAHMLQPTAQDTILDIAAAPGMKSAMLAAYVNKHGILISNDVSPKRAKVMHERLSYQKDANINILVSDAGNQCQLPIKTKSIDKVLLDAPCSSTGIIGTYPDHRWHKKINFKRFSELQKKMFVECLRVLKTGGTGVYSVCSIHYLEGEEIIKTFLDKITLQDPVWGDPQSCFTTTLENEEFSPEIGKYCRRLYPHRDQTAGFFYAKFQKK